MEEMLMTGQIHKADGSLERRVIDVLATTLNQSNFSWNSDSSMDDIEGWDSLTYFEVVTALESSFGVAFDEEEVTQLFQVGHIVQILRDKIFGLPHGDVSHAYIQLADIISTENAMSPSSLVIISASSTREALQTMSECQVKLQNALKDNDYIGGANWYNLSVSGLVLAEAVQIVEVISRAGSSSPIIVIGISPIIMGGCGIAEFERAARRDRFLFESEILNRAFVGTPYDMKDQSQNRQTWDPASWAKEYLFTKGGGGKDLIYNPYIYPAVNAWSEKKHRDYFSIDRFYNNSYYNFDESFEINEVIFDELIDLMDHANMRYLFCKLPIHPATDEYLELFGQLRSRYEKWKRGISIKRGIRFIDPGRVIGLAPKNFRDPAHIFERRDEFTDELLKQVISGLSLI
jgi:acyl carrier protein